MMDNVLPDIHLTDEPNLLVGLIVQSRSSNPHAGRFAFTCSLRYNSGLDLVPA